MNSWRSKAVSASWDAKWPSLQLHPEYYPPCHHVFQPKPYPPPLKPTHPSRSMHRLAPQSPSTPILSHQIHHRPLSLVSLPTLTSAGANRSAHHLSLLRPSAPNNHDHVCRTQRETTHLAQLLHESVKPRSHRLSYRPQLATQHTGRHHAHGPPDPHRSPAFL